MQSGFVTIAKLIAPKHYFCKEVFCNNFGRDGTIIGHCPRTLRPVFPVFAFQLSKQQNRTRTTSSTVLGTPPNRTWTKKFPGRGRPRLRVMDIRAQMLGFPRF